MPTPVSMHVQADSVVAPWRPIWNWFGYDEPNYTYMRYGKELLADLSALHEGPVFVRAHNLLTSGDGAPALKWGSTNVYTEDAGGEPAYSWDILDRIFDTYVECGVTPFVQLGFMPEALSTNPQPYRHDFPHTGITTGWAWPPKDFGRWGELIEAVARHMVERYGAERVTAWPWEVWNEPDGHYWRGSVEEFCRLHDVAAAAVRQAVPGARVGGPHTCGPTSEIAARYLRDFLSHCTSGCNFATGETGTPLDFVAFHAKGQPQVVDGHVRMGIARQLTAIANGLKIVGEFEALAGLPVILGESDPEGCAACSTATHPQNAYRDGPLYGASVVEATIRTMELSQRAGIAIEGAVTWAFEFEGEPFFAGFRELATNGIAKPVLNALRMLAMLKGHRLAAQSSAALPIDTILADGVVAAPDVDVDVAATRDGEAVNILLWNYHDDDLPDADAADVSLEVTGLGEAPVVRRHFRMDRDHSNAHTLFLAEGAPQPPSAAQYARFDAADGLQTLDEPHTMWPVGGALRLRFSLPRSAVSLISLARN